MYIFIINYKKYQQHKVKVYKTIKKLLINYFINYRINYFKIIPK